jgi:hypothetical protein
MQLACFGLGQTNYWNQVSAKLDIMFVDSGECPRAFAWDTGEGLKQNGVFYHSVWNVNQINVPTNWHSLDLGYEIGASLLKTLWARRCNLDVLGENWAWLVLTLVLCGLTKVTFTVE